MITLVALALPLPSNSIPGELTPAGCIQDVGLADCGPTQQGLDDAEGVAVSPDGTSVYVASMDDDAIVRFDRDPATGALTPAGCIQDLGLVGCGANQQGLDGAREVAVSPDGTSVYVASQFDDAIVRFDRDPTTGALAPAGCIQHTGKVDCGPTHPALDGARGVAVSPDGRSVYVASVDDDAVVRFDRDPASGALTPAACIQDEFLCDCSPNQQGLDGASGVVVSSDGASVYVASQLDDAVVRFDRNPDTGALTPAACIQDTGVADCGATQQGLNGAVAVAVSPEGTSVYVASIADDAVVRFDRNITTGALSPAGCIQDAGLADCGPTQHGLNSAADVVVSPDGRSVYVASFADDAIVRFDRAPTSGALTGAGCIQDVGLADCGVNQQGLDGAFGVGVSLDERSVYVASGVDNAIVRFDREPTLPETTITKGPKKRTEKRKARFAFTSDEKGSTFKCKVDKKGFKPCTSPKKVRVKPGRHRFQVRATDPGGNTDPTPAKRKWRVLTD